MPAEGSHGPDDRRVLAYAKSDALIWSTFSNDLLTVVGFERARIRSTTTTDDHQLLFANCLASEAEGVGVEQRVVAVEAYRGDIACR